MVASIPDTRPFVLAIDDDALILRYLQIALDRAGYRSAIAVDPESAMEMVRKAKPDLILLDVRLSDVDSFDLYEDIQTIAPIPVIFLSASNQTEDRRRALSAGASGYVVKPFSPPQLMQVIAETLAHTP